MQHLAGFFPNVYKLKKDIFDVEKMNKKIIISVVIVLIIVISLLFIVLYNDEKSRFIGNWEYSSTENEIEILSWNITFFNNDSAKMEYISDQYHGESVTWNKYSINNNRLCFEISNEIPEGFENLFPDIEDIAEECYNYDFTNEDNTLSLTSEGITFVFIRK